MVVSDEMDTYRSLFLLFRKHSSIYRELLTEKIHLSRQCADINKTVYIQIHCVNYKVLFLNHKTTPALSKAKFQVTVRGFKS